MRAYDDAKLDALMDSAGMDLVLASSRHNVRYLTGGYIYHFNERSQRMGSGRYLAFVGVPKRTAANAFYIGTGGERHGLDVLPMGIEHRDLDAGDASSSSRVAARIQSFVGPRATVGVEMPFLPADAFVALRSALPHATFIDATDLLHELRAIKTPDEIAALRAVSERIAAAIQEGFGAGYDGVTTHEIARAVERAMGAANVAFLWALTNAGPGYLRAPSGTRWERGRLFHLDCGGEVGDYLADICRMGSLGEPSALGRALVDECLAVQDTVRGRLRAGMTYGEVKDAARGALAGSTHAAIGRIVAHGIGMVSHEQPMINRPDQADRILAEGHVLSVETEFLHPEIGHVKIEDTVAIAPQGAVGLGDGGRALRVIG